MGSIVVLGGVQEGLVEVHETRGGDDVAVDQVRKEAHDVARRLPHAGLQRVLQLARHQVYQLKHEEKHEESGLPTETSQQGARAYFRIENHDFS